LEAPVRRVNSCLGKFWAKNLGFRHGEKGHTRLHHFMSYLLQSRTVTSLPCCVKAHGMSPWSLML